MSHAAIPTPISIKYWHDKTLRAQGWWRLMPLIGLALAAMATALIWAAKALIEAINNYREAQKADAALDSFRAAVDPNYKQGRADSSWLKGAIIEGLAESGRAEEEETPHHCTCISNGNGGVYCSVHGNMYR